MGTWLVRVKENSRECRDSRYRSSHHPTAETLPCCPRRSPPPQGLGFRPRRGQSHGSQDGRKATRSSQVGLARNLPSGTSGEDVCVGRCHSSELTVKSRAGAPEETIHEEVACWWHHAGKLSEKMLGEAASHWALQELKEPLL